MLSNFLLTGCRLPALRIIAVHHSFIEFPCCREPLASHAEHSLGSYLIIRASFISMFILAFETHPFSLLSVSRCSSNLFGGVVMSISTCNRFLNVIAFAITQIDLQKTVVYLLDIFSVM